MGIGDWLPSPPPPRSEDWLQHIGSCFCICLGVTIHVPIYSKPKKKIESCFPDGVYRYINDLVPNNFQVPNLCIYLFGGCYMWDFCWLLSSIPSLGIPKKVIWIPNWLIYRSGPGQVSLWIIGKQQLVASIIAKCLYSIVNELAAVKPPFLDSATVQHLRWVGRTPQALLCRMWQYFFVEQKSDHDDLPSGELT